MSISSFQFQDFLRQKYANQNLSARADMQQANAAMAGVGQRGQAAQMQYGPGGSEERVQNIAQQGATERQAMEWGPAGTRMTMFNKDFPFESALKRAQASNYSANAGLLGSQTNAQNEETGFFRSIKGNKRQRYFDETSALRDAYNNTGSVASPGYYSIFNR